MVLRTGDLLICWIVADLSAIEVVLARAEGVLAFVKELIQMSCGSYDPKNSSLEKTFDQYKPFPQKSISEDRTLQNWSIDIDCHFEMTQTRENKAFFPEKWIFTLITTLN